jgi:tRNA(fMet)-specific endonuclease VapC
MYGAANSQRPTQIEEKVALFILSGDINILPFDTKDAAIAGSIRAKLRQAGELIGPYDLLIAAQTIKAGATLITANTREFSRIPGLTVVDWAIK